MAVDAAMSATVTTETIILPHDVGLEAEVLAACIISPIDARTPAAWLEADDFHVTRHQHIWRAILDCYAEHNTVDEVLLPAALRRAGTLDAVGLKAIVELMSRSGTSSNVGEYARIIRSFRVRRDMIKAAQDVEVEALTSDGDIMDLVEMAERRIRAATELAAPHTVAGGLTAIQEHRRRCEAATSGEGVSGLRSGVRALDSACGGLQGGWLVLVMAPPGGGKSALAVNNYAMAALEDGRPVLVFSLEMPPADVVGRLVAAKCGVAFSVQRGGRMTTDERVAYTHGLAEVEQWPIYIEEDCHRLTPESVRLACLRVVQDAGSLGLVVFDYLQLARGMTRRRDATDEQEISSISRTLKQIAIEFDVPVLALSQPDKQGQRAGGRLRLADAKGSQAIGADADLALFPRFVSPKPADGGDDAAPIFSASPARLCEIAAPKFRHGPPFFVSQHEVSWNGDRMRFEGA